MNSTVKIHPTAVIEGDVQIGDGCVIAPHVYIKGPAIIGKNNRIGASTVIGTDGESRGLDSVGTIHIGDDNFISDLVTIQRSIGDRDTQIGNNCFVMAHCHIAHDCKLGNDVTIAAGAVLAGHVVVLDGATIGIGAVAHQKTTIGAYSMVGMNSTVNKDVPPFGKAFGTPIKIKGKNDHRIKLLNIDNLDESPVYKETLVQFDQYKGRK